MSDATFLPGSGGGFRPAERPEKLKTLVQRLEGKQLSVLHYLPTGPTGSRGFGFEFTDGERWMCWAARSTDSAKYRAVLAWRMLEKPKIWTPARRKHFGSGRAADSVLDPPDALQLALEGQVLRGLRFSETPTSRGGEEHELEWADGSLLILGAVPIRKVVYNKEPGSIDIMTADIAWDLTEPRRKPLVL